MQQVYLSKDTSISLYMRKWSANARFRLETCFQPHLPYLLTTSRKT